MFFLASRTSTKVQQYSGKFAFYIRFGSSHSGRLQSICGFEIMKSIVLKTLIFLNNNTFKFLDVHNIYILVNFGFLGRFIIY